MRADGLPPEELKRLILYPNPTHLTVGASGRVVGWECFLLYGISSPLPNKTGEVSSVAAPPSLKLQRNSFLALCPLLK